MKLSKIGLLLILPLLAVSCSNDNKTSNNVTSTSFISSTDVSTSQVSSAEEVISEHSSEETTTEASENSQSASQSSVTPTSEKISVVSSSENKTTSVTVTSSSSKTTSSSSSKVTSLNSVAPINSEDYDANHDPLPININSKIVLGSDNKSLSSFSFYGGCPQYFRGIYGKNYTAGEFYKEDGESIQYKITDPGRGFQTCAFEGNLKLEIRLNIGDYHSKQSTTINKNDPIMIVTGFDDYGNSIRTYDLENDVFKPGTNNHTIQFYMDGTNISYLEFVCKQLPYSGSKGYNFGVKSLDMIAWPYALK